MDVKSILLAVILMSIIPFVPSYAISVDCFGNSIERVNTDEVKINGVVYSDGDNISLDGITYTIVMIGSSGPTNNNDFIVGTDNADSIDGLEGKDFIVGLDGNDVIYGDRIFGTSNDDVIVGEDDIICGNNGDDVIYGDVIYGLEGNDEITGGNDEIDGGDGNDEIYGDDILGNEGADIIKGGDDEIDGGDGNDRISGEVIRRFINEVEEGDDSIKGGHDSIKGDNGDDTIYGDEIYGFGGDDEIIGGNDSIKGGNGNDDIIGDYLHGLDGYDTIIAGNDIIEAIDGVINNDSIDGELIFAGEDVTNGIDICSSDPDNEVNCEEDDLSSVATFEPDNNPINQGDNVNLMFDIDDGIGPVTITGITVQTPLGDVCNYNTLPTTIDIGGELIATYPNQFNGANCDTNTAGVYTATLETEVGDPIVTIFNTSFNVLPESIIGAIGMIGASIAVFMLYIRKH